MATPTSHKSGPFQFEDVSRREVLLRVGAGGLALALATRGAAVALAQEASPAPGAIVAEPLIAIPLDELPAAPVSFELIRLTMEPGANSPATSAHGVLEVIYVESGTLICPGGEGRTVYAPDGTVTASGEGDLEIPTGSAIVVPPDALDGARNDGTVPVVAMIIHLGSVDGDATPTM